MGKEYYINSLIRAVEILELFHGHDAELGISDMARALDLYKSTVHRIVSTLEYKGLLEQNPDTGKYRLGLNLYRLGIKARADNELIAVSLPHLKELTAQTGETSNLVVMDGTMAVYVAQEESDRMVRMFTRIGARVYPHCSGAGKVLMSELTPEQLDALISANGLNRYTGNTIDNKEALEKELDTVRRQGYALDNQEREEGVKCIAAPIRDKSGRIIAALSISGPRDRFEEERLGALIEIVRTKTQQISSILGFKP